MGSRKHCFGQILGKNGLDLLPFL